MSTALPSLTKLHDCAYAIARLDDGQLVALVSSVQVREFTKEIRSASTRMMRLHDDLGLDHTLNRLSRGNFASEKSQALEVEATLPEAAELAAIERFAMAAVVTAAPREIVVGIVSYLAKVLSLSGGVSPERISAVVDTLTDHEHQPMYGTFMTGFSVPVVQLAVRSILETAKWFPTPVELLEECLKASRFLLQAGFAARRQAHLRANAEAILEAEYAASGNDDEFPF